MQTGNSLYQFNRDDAFRFADFIGHKAFQRGNELIFVKCPYCGNTSDKKNKFAINLQTGQFNCFRASCSAKGNMITLSHDFNFQISEEVDRYINRNNYNNQFKKFRNAHRITESKSEAVEYLSKRGISEETCRKYEITVIPEQRNVLVFPFKNQEGELTFIKYRNMAFEKGVSQGSKEWCEKNCKPILFGMNHCVDFETLVITEGQLDSLSLSTVGIKNAVSVPLGMNAFNWVSHCWDWLCQFKDIVVFGDCEKGNVTLADTISKRFPKKTRIVEIASYQGYKDANEILLNCGSEALIEAVNGAVSCLKSRIKYMENVQFRDIEKVETIKTNIKEIDSVLTGGFKVGTLTILSGKRGNGKSTVASYFGIEALNQGHKVFIYSGELPDFFVRNWIDRQVIGVNPLSNAQIEQAGRWYSRRLLVYDNDLVADDDSEMTETELLLETMEDVIVHEGVKFLILDNLMTAMDDVSSNDALYQGQRKFVRTLAKMAKKYEVIIILVAHPRKSQMDFDNDSVSGSSVITDAADLVMSYDKISDNKDPDFGDDDVRILSVTKNRLTGRMGKIKLWFSGDSKRITGANKNFVRDYFDTDFEEINTEGDIPFD